MIPRLKRQTKKRHGVRSTGLRIRWKEGGQWVSNRTPKYKRGSVTVTLTPEGLALVGAAVSPDVFGSTVQIHYKQLV